MATVNTEAGVKKASSSKDLLQDVFVFFYLKICFIISYSKAQSCLFSANFTEPVITYAPRPIVTTKGSDAIFSCEVSSYPLASIQWSKEGDVISFPADDSSTVVQVCAH